jgi:isoquinoline 1-oxidoreductase beta subunit
MVAEVSVDSAAAGIRVRRMVAAVDCGRVVNPDNVIAQIEGGIAFGLTAAIKAQATFKDGRIQQSNFDDYPILRMDEMPVVEGYIIPSESAPSGIGEMGVPPVAPAVANAVFMATGKRVRRIPILPQMLY